MGKSFASVGAALPPRRDELVVARAGGSMPSVDSGSIIIPDARDRMLELIEREQLPNDVRQTLNGSLTGDMARQQLLFQAMLDTWPRLQKCVTELKRAVRKALWQVVPYAPRGEKPDKAAEKLAKEVEQCVWAMKPDPKRGLKGFEGLVEELVIGYLFGHQVLEVNWHQVKGEWRPKNVKVVPPRFYGYPNWEAGEDRLMLDPQGGQSGMQNFEDFPDHKFLIAVNGGHPGHPTVAAPLRALTGYWLGAVYGLKWLMQFAQLFGIPFRWAEYTEGSKSAKEEVVNMMRRIGSEGWGAFPAGTKLNFLDSSKGGGSLVQVELLKLADEQCDIFILGQSLTSSQGERGSQSLGQVHMEVRQEVVEGVCDFAGEVLTHQLAPSIVLLNYGERDDVPGIWAKFEKAKDEKGMAERDKTLGLLDGTFPVEADWIYERHGVPRPADGATLFMEKPEPVAPAAIGPAGKPVPVPPGNTLPFPKKEKVAAADAGLTWERFPDDSGSLGIPRAEMPQIRSGDRAAMVQFFRARGVESRQAEVPAASLKPTQAEYSPDKVAMASAYEGGNRAILISEDDHVVDGHHQWMSAVQAGETIRVIRLMAPISRVLMMAHRMPSTSVAASIREDLDDGRRGEADDMVDRMEKLAEGGLLDVDAAAAALAKVWIDGAKGGEDA